MQKNMFTAPPPFPGGEPGFITDLTTWKTLTPHWKKDAAPGAGELDLKAGIEIQNSFPDPEGVLDSVLGHMKRFFAAAGLPEKGKNILLLEADSGLSREDYRWRVTAAGMTLSAGTTEGIRRGLYFVEEELAGARGPFLPFGTTEKHAWLHNRISRCFFGPIKRPPFHHDELMDEIDYYPDAYLDRLAREGVNGLWLTIVFREICKTSFLPVNPDAEKRLAKLRRSVEKCRRFGIKLWVFAIEPAAWNLTNPVPEGFPELAGPSAYNLARTFCPNSEAAERYLYESTHSLFSEVPHLGGLLLISHGERSTSCLSTCSTLSDGDIPCDRRCSMSSGGILHKVLAPMRRGIADANPDAELISWLYQPQPDQAGSWIYDMPSELTEDIILAYNFESGCNKSQLGKLRNGGDYWLSCTGPAERFGRMAQAARGKCAFAAKLQVGCSHEVATIPFVPAPGILYRKYKEMKRLGVSHVMQCWYFGNYPGVMNLAAGRLAYENFDDTERDFLIRLARPEWGSSAADVADGWLKLGEAYSYYPLGYEFQYYGPMHDGPVWPLHLRLVHERLPRTWKPDADPAGDAVGECLLNFEAHEAVLLTRKLAALWSEGAGRMREVVERFRGDREREMDLDVIEALECQFASGADILRFYFLRNRLINNGCNPEAVLDEMEAIVKKELAVSEKLHALCLEDPRLGYHSEAEVYKYFPAKLQWRVGQLNELLKKEFPAVRAEIAAGKTPAEALAADQEFYSIGKEYASGSFRWSAELDSEYLRFTVEADAAEGMTMDSIFLFVNDRLGAFRPRSVTINLLVPGFDDSLEVASGKVEARDGKIHAKIAVPMESLRDGDGCRIGFQRCSTAKDGKVTMESFPAGTYDNDYRLQYGLNSPERTRLLKF